jgi:hypothetical protein
MTPKENVFDVEALEEQIKIANKQKDDYAIEFAVWVEWYDFAGFKSKKELLEIFKKEKGL